MSILSTLLPTIWEVMVRDFRLQDLGFKGGGGGVNGGLDPSER